MCLGGLGGGKQLTLENQVSIKEVKALLKMCVARVFLRKDGDQ